MSAEGGRYKNISVVCQTLGFSRQAYYQRLEVMEQERYQREIVLELVIEQRQKMPRVGTRKLLHLLREDFARLEYKLGRDELFNILREHGMLVKPNKSYTKTTNSFHHYYVYKNLIHGLAICRPDQVFVSDITYIRVGSGFMYLSLITDLFSRMIVGWHLSESLDAAGSILALNMALAEVKDPSLLIHHSDRGVQYCCKEYTRVLLASGVSISMAEIGNPYENAVAERVNGILKGEFFLDQIFSSASSARIATAQAVQVYNDIRPHLSLKMATPSQKYYEGKNKNKLNFSAESSPLKGGTLVTPTVLPEPTIVPSTTSFSLEVCY